jgi:hypothetical protein
MTSLRKWLNIEMLQPPDILEKEEDIYTEQLLAAQQQMIWHETETTNEYPARKN